MEKIMSKNTWVISDTHFGHANILNFMDDDGNLIRGDFENVDHMNECMIDNWNSVVKNGDSVYHLGDVFFGPKENFEGLWPKLNGSKRLIVGNHDDIKYLAGGGFFKKVMMWRMWPEFGLLMSHVPVHESSLKIFVKHKGYEEGDVGDVQEHLMNIHGHIHQNPSPSPNHRNVSVEAINYTPVNIEELRIK
jgi:calcineurin-like phosphoesterase family protein